MNISVQVGFISIGCMFDTIRRCIHPELRKQEGENVDEKLLYANEFWPLVHISWPHFLSPSPLQVHK